jgi:hypothetical protein
MAITPVCFMVMPFGTKPTGMEAGVGPAQIDFLNDYYPSSNLPRLYRERAEKGDEKKATSAAVVAMLACERSRARNPQDPWATLLGAALDAGDVTSARKSLEEIKRIGMAAFPLGSTLPDLRRSLNLLSPPW